MNAFDEIRGTVALFLFRLIAPRAYSEILAEALDSDLAAFEAAGIDLTRRAAD